MLHIGVGVHVKQRILGLHGRNTPSGSELYYVGQVPRGHDTARRGVAQKHERALCMDHLQEKKWYLS